MRFPKRTVRILSVDGGGIRGYIAALMLEEIEKRRLEMGKKHPLSRSFDLMAGTSTGSLITLGLSAPELPQQTPLIHRDIHKLLTGRKPKYTSADIARLYRERGAEIFPQHIFRQLRTVRHAFFEKYDAGSFDRVLEESFGELTLKDALTTVLVTSYDTLTGKPLIMKNLAKEDNYYIRDAARGSSAAPTYFEPVKVKSLVGGKEHCLVDGGVFANNPAMCAYVEARRLYPLAGRFVILSLGTGRLEKTFTHKQIKNWGYMEWVLPSNGVPLISMMSSGQNKCVDYQMEHLPGVDYIRLNPNLDGCSDEMDDACPENMACLESVARRAIRENNQLIDRLARLL
jgi:patatin-like phospholipase/acyl hydrolase